MARQSHNIVSGQIGPVVFYVVNGVGYARSAAQKVKQTKATKESAKLFGKAVTIAGFLRREITGGLPDLRKNEAQYRFDNAMAQWLRLGNMNGKQEKLQDINGFEFNEKSPLHSRFKQPFDVDFSDKGRIHFTVPEFNIPSDVNAPAHSHELPWHVLVTSCDIRNKQGYGHAYDHVEMSFAHGNVAAQRISLDCEIYKGTLTVVAVALRYAATRKGKVVLVKEPAWLPTAIVGSYYLP